MTLTNLFDACVETCIKSRYKIFQEKGVEWDAALAPLDFFHEKYFSSKFRILFEVLE